MRDERIACVIAAFVNKRLGGHHVGIVQGSKFTGWCLGDKVFAVGPYLTEYPTRKLAETIITYLTPPKPIRKKHEDD